MKGRVTNTGYLDNSPDRFNDYNVIPSQHITMRGVSQPIMMFPIKNNKVANPVHGIPGEEYYFPGAQGVVEMPLPQGNMSYQRMVKGGSSEAKMREILSNVAYSKGGNTMTPELAAKILKSGSIYGKTLTSAQRSKFAELAEEIGIDENGDPIDKKKDKSEDVEEYRRGGSLPKAKKKHSRTTSKNIYTAINELFARNTMLYGTGGKEFYKPELRRGGWLDKFDLPKAQVGLQNQKPINVTTAQEIASMKELGYPIYTGQKEFYDKNKNLETFIRTEKNIKGEKQKLLRGDDMTFQEKWSGSGPSLTYNYQSQVYDPSGKSVCVGDQCTARANRAISSLYLGSGKSFYENPDVTKTQMGASYSTQSAPTEQQQQMYDYMMGDTQFGSLDAWDIVPLAKKKIPKNVIFSAVVDIPKGERDSSRGKYETEYSKKAIKAKDAWKKYDIPIGSFINVGKSHDYNRSDIVAGSHTLRVVGYANDGEPIVADFGKIVPLSQSMYADGDDDYVAGIVTVPGKEKYTYNWFKNQAKEASKPNTTPYIADINKKGNVTSGIIEDRIRDSDLGRALGAKEAKYDEDYKEFHDTLMGKKNKLRTELGLEGDVYDKYAKIALTLGGVETNFGKGTLYRTLDRGDSTGISQLNKTNVVDKYKNILSKYEEGTPEYDAVASLLYIKSLDDYRKGWLELGNKNKERPYVRTDYETMKGIIRSAQDHDQKGYLNADWGGDEFAYEGGTIELPFKTPGESDQEYKDEVNKVLKAKDPNLRFDYDKKGNRVIYKKTKGNAAPIKDNLEDFVFYAWQSPNSVVYGDAAGDSKYYQKAKKIYSELFGGKPQTAENLPKKKMGGSTGWLDSYQ